MATLLSSLTYVGLTGEVVKNGIAGFMMQLAILPAALVVIPIFIPFFMRLRFTSAYEYLEHRFDYRTRLLGGGLFLLLGQVLGAGLAVLVVPLLERHRGALRPAPGRAAAARPAAGVPPAGRAEQAHGG